ncbi:MAG: family acetyltransferase [Frondihabitans sp.]|nr:family acetyltransferase [Frondihabitans sp.]
MQNAGVTDVMVLEVLDKHWTDPDGAQLRCEQQAEIAIRYGTDNSEPGIKPSAGDIAEFVVAYAGGKPVGCGALRQLTPEDDGTAPAGDAEIKRMFVRTSSRGSGASIAVLRALEDRARSHGWTRLVLETGPGQPDAIRFYEREGYVRIENYGHYRGNKMSWCFGKTLSGE